MENDTPTLEQPSTSPQPARTNPLPSNNLVIQPVSDMSEYVKPAPAPVVAPTATNNEQPVQTTPVQKSPVPANIYPEVGPSMHSYANPQPVAELQANKGDQRVAAQCMSLQIYAILQLVISAYLVWVFISFAGSSVSNSSSGGTGSVMTYVGGIVLVDLLISLYLLLSKNAYVINVILTVILVFSGLGLFGSLATILFAQNAQSFLSGSVSIGSFIFLWYVKSQVGRLV